MNVPRSSLDRLVDLYKALGHPVRLRIVAMLRSGELCACQITAVLKLAPSTVSAHLGELRRAGALVERKEGRWVIFRHAEDENVRGAIAAGLEGLSGDARIEADARIVKRLRRVSVEKLCRVDLDLARVGIREPVALRRRAWKAS
jgi:DNA-binding transcriptional ArsR family regulator